MSYPSVVPQDPQADVWDVVVIGTGAGGGTAGFDLARRGHSVLFLERGHFIDRQRIEAAGSWDMYRSDSWSPEAALKHGWWPARVHENVDGIEQERPAVFGCGVGGSTGLFGMVMDRLRPEDFNPGRYYSDSDSTLPDTWPISFHDLEHFYREAEALYRVRGTVDPTVALHETLLPPPSPSEMETILLQDLGLSGLHPYRMHYARELVAGCRGCSMSACPHHCRNDSRRVCVEPALERYGAQILPDCRVERLESRSRAVQAAVCSVNGRRVVVRGKIFVLAANAFFSPALLQRSANEAFPDGLANSSGMLGRNLMFHVSDNIWVRPLRHSESDGRLTHGISLNDFYVRDEFKLGNLHAHAAGSRRGTKVPAKALFSTIVEDLPYIGNRVTAARDSLDGVVWEYTRSKDLRERSRRLIRRFAAATRSRFEIAACGPTGKLNMGRCCGTCRFGDDARTSVLDRNNRAHDLDNLYVVDASFFPSSGGIQPSLTIAANSLRVCREISRRI